jgi:NAD(P)H-dependent FMN reductase
MTTRLTLEILSLSASTVSVSRSCVPAVQHSLTALGHASNVTDIRDLPPVWSSNIKVPDLPDPYTQLFNRVQAADGVIFCLPIYCYAASGAAKTVSEILGGHGGALTRKPVAFVVASGTMRSHLAVRDLMSSMAFEQFSYCYPRHVGVQSEDLLADGSPSRLLVDRINEISKEFIRFCVAIRDLHTSENLAVLVA